MKLLNLRLTHNEASLPVLEAARIDNVHGVYNKISESRSAIGLVVIQTCNRTEIFAELRDGEGSSEEASKRLMQIWAENVRNPVFFEFVRRSDDAEAVIHLVRLACGLDSMAVGESQVTQQIIEAYRFSKDCGFASGNLSRIFESTIRAARKIRALSGLAGDVTDLGELAVRHAEKLMADRFITKVLVIGTGKAGRQVLRALETRAIDGVWVAGRNPEHTRNIAIQFNATAISIESCLDLIGALDVVFVATSSNTDVLTAEGLASRLSPDHNKRLLVIDLSNPRNVDPAIGHLEQVILATMDDLRHLAIESAHLLRNRIFKGEELAASEALRIWSLAKATEVEPIVALMFRGAETVRRRELQKALKHLDEPSTHTLRTLDQMTRSIVEGVLTEAAQQIREAAVRADGSFRPRTLRHLVRGG